VNKVNYKETHLTFNRLNSTRFTTAAAAATVAVDAGERRPWLNQSMPCRVHCCLSISSTRWRRVGRRRYSTQYTTCVDVFDSFRRQHWTSPAGVTLKHWTERLLAVSDVLTVV